MNCPKCGNDSMPDFMGHEVWGVYDGTLVWQCMKCGHAFPRNFGIPRRDAKAREVADQLNSAAGVMKSSIREDGGA